MLHRGGPNWPRSCSKDRILHLETPDVLLTLPAGAALAIITLAPEDAFGVALL